MSKTLLLLSAISALLLSGSNGFSIRQTTRYFPQNLMCQAPLKSPESTGILKKEKRGKRMQWIILSGTSLIASRLVPPAGAASTVSTSTGSTSPSYFSPWQYALIALVFLFKSIGGQALHFIAQQARRSITWYMIHLESSPLITKSITSGVLGICGDYMAQWLEYKLGKRRSTTPSCSWKHVLRIHQTYDFRRGLAILADGFFISGPLMHVGYNLFETILPTTGAHRGAAALAHVVADSILLDSIFVASAFIITGLMEGYRLRTDIWPQFHADYGPTLRASWATSLILMPLEFVCFRFLPVTFRTLAMNITDIIWDTVVSFMAHRSRLASHS